MHTASFRSATLAGDPSGVDPCQDADSYHLLDDADEWRAFSRPVPDAPNLWESSVVFEGMHCAACAITIEDALKQVPGVLRVEVNAASHRGRVVWSDQTVAPSAWMQAAQTAGYRPMPANDASVRELRRSESRMALWRLSVAGLCMMQVMMYAWPAYIAQPGDISPDMAQLLRWASWVLSMPVLLFSCAPFFQSAWRDLLQRRISMDLPVALGMLITFAVSSLGTFDPLGPFGQEVYFDSFTMFVFFLLAGRWLELRLRDKTAGSLEALMNRLPDSVNRRTASGHFERVAVRRLRLGDVLRVLPGEAFPADGLLLEGQTLVDEALLTGESKPLARQPGDAVIAGSHNLAAPVLVRAQRLGDDTRFAQIVALMQSASTVKPQSAQLVDRWAKPFLWFVLLAASLSGAYWWQHEAGGLSHALMVAVAVLVVTCPCALSLATPAAMLASAGALARSGILVRRLQALEALAGIDTVVFDKTGTLTRDSFKLARVVCRPGVEAAFAVGLAAAIARYSLHPVSRALVAAANEPSMNNVIVFDVAERHGEGIEALLRVGSTAAQTVRLGSSAFAGSAQGDQGVTGLQAHLSDEAGWLASFELSEDLRPDAAACLQILRGLGVQALLLSGDSVSAVQRVAEQAGLTQALGQCTPADKLAHLQALQAAGHRVAMVGDGLNDGPVLAGANVSFAFGQAVPLAQAQSDLVVLSPHLVSIANALMQARRTLVITRQNLRWAVAYNAVCVPLAVLGYLPAWLAGLGMAVSSLFVVLNAMRLVPGQKLPGPFKPLTNGA